ncbi:MAG TPA: 2'-5' RNA ligase family protein [Dermatophilaceae bacterium]|nr:2'-5' RNA ligase family protein [Dermatophilaceae bacterium]
MISVSIAIPAPFADELQGLRASFGDPLAEAIPSHVTLLSPTEVDHDLMPEIHEHLERIAAAQQPFVMLLRSTGTFRPISPVVFVQVAGGIGECEQIELAIRTGPLKRVPQFYYHPHVTVAHHVDEAAMDRAFDELASYQCSFEVGAFRLYEHDADLVSHVVRTFDFSRGPQSGSARLS